VKCKVCRITFTTSDILEIKTYNEIPVCDECLCNELDIHVKYDGSDDLLEYLKRHVHSNKVCSSCDSDGVELIGIKFGNPIKGYISCGNCDTEYELNIYLHMT